jgi:hypothetical protein
MLILLLLLANCIELEQVAEDRLAPYRQPLLPMSIFYCNNMPFVA